MKKMMMNENEPAARWNISPKTLQRWRSEGRGPRFMKMSKRVVHPIDEVFIFESQALRSATWAKASDVVLPDGSKLMDAREISYVTGLPLYIFTQRNVREALGIPHRRVEKLIRFDCDEVMAWAKRWSQEARDQGIEARIDPDEQRRSLQQALASLPV
ncbi:hypothetical protein HF289_03155 [Acidithiobacillus ferrooxidans]|jgi:hypothetical protein|uniref:hypothetical protein n=1 Tax=Acidithiobacillus ferrooxidans TaxID=920 RepID=UPI001C07A2C2|nr:hypothetical protein [Acidithiobacillus ferrooxidans]MBU2855910.1 hypothetical protein [Acidithiobacillus ferrooxidans]MBU2860837.1 hypothetical protein [Acidithiobacillus ferrooxidans]